MIGDEKIYFYHLILDRQYYFDGFKKLKKDRFITDSLEFMNSYQSIEIFEDGRISHVLISHNYTGFWLSISAATRVSL
ncbi:hypothetical protein [Sporosarcina sp. PTS2304]|uniref:hypothetical protein n=1 Tax=Sporosarcina sp. PTS2304 TaxID=2283194 RepID=UPI001964FF4D|nr:hypothetical protein [Sporosarcina sp. PTS2304]